MIRMIDAIGGEQGLWIACDEYIGPVLTDDPHHITTQFKVRDEVPVRTVQKVNRLCADHIRGVVLFHMSYILQSGGSHVRLRVGIESLIPAGQDVIRDLMSLERPACQGA